MEVYKETEFLKKSIGPVLVSALAEVCLKRPADPIEFLGHWLLRWRYNDELKKRDMENALNVVKALRTTRCSGELKWKDACGAGSLFNQGVTQIYPFLPPGYGGPIDASLLKGEEEDEEEDDFRPPRFQEYGGEGDLGNLAYETGIPPPPSYQEQELYEQNENYVEPDYSISDYPDQPYPNQEYSNQSPQTQQYTGENPQHQRYPSLNSNQNYADPNYQSQKSSRSSYGQEAQLESKTRQSNPVEYSVPPPESIANQK